MDPAIVGAMLAAALMHASWHAMIKVSGDKMIGLAGMNVVSTTVAACMIPFVTIPPAQALAVLVGSIFLHGAYKVALAHLYRLGDFSQIYPIARGLTPVLAAMLALALLSEVPSPVQSVGIILVSAGLIVAAAGKGRPSVAALATALFASLMVAAYSAVDAFGARISGDWLGYTVWLVLLDGGAFVAFTGWRRGEVLWSTLNANRRATIISGLLGVGSFGVFLWALSRGAVGGVAALRETSVLFATLIGILVLKEKPTAARLAGAGLIMAGIGTLAAGGN